MSEHDPDLPPELEQFGRILVRQLHVRRRREQRRRLLLVGAIATALLTGSAIAATRALQGQPSVKQLNETQNLAAAKELLTREIARDADVHAEISATRLLLTLPASTGTLAGLNAYITPTRGGGYCITMLNSSSCGSAPDATVPAKGLGLELPNAPYVLVGIEASNVRRHTITCGGTRRDVTSNAGPHRFYFTAPRGADTSACTQTSTFANGASTTTPL